MIAVTLIEIPQWGTLSLVEAIWLTSGLIALTFASLRMRPLWNDVQHAVSAHEADVCVIAKGYLRRELIRVAQSLCVVGIGLYSAVEPPAIPGPARISIVGLVITAVLITISALVAVQSLLDWRDRNEIKRIVGGTR